MTQDGSFHQVPGHLPMKDAVFASMELWACWVDVSFWGPRQPTNSYDLESSVLYH